MQQLQKLKAAGVTAKVEDKKAEEKAKSEAKQTPEVKESKKELTQVLSEAEVLTNWLRLNLLRLTSKKKIRRQLQQQSTKNQPFLLQQRHFQLMRV